MTRLAPGSAVVYMERPGFLLVIHERTPQQRRRKTARMRAKHVKYQNAMTARWRSDHHQHLSRSGPGPNRV